MQRLFGNAWIKVCHQSHDALWVFSVRGSVIFILADLESFWKEGITVGKDEFTFHHLETEDDVAQHLELMRKVFGQNSRVDLQVKKWLDHHPRMTLKDFFIMKHNGKVVACLNIIPSKWSIGGIPLKVAEIACVATLPDYRHQGLQARLMDEYHRQVSKQGYDLAAIQGIPYYYRQFGYDYALPLDEATKIRIDQIPDCEQKHTIRPFAKTDMPKAKQLLAQAKQKYYVHAVRDDDIWKMQLETGMVAEYTFEGYALEERGEMIAYFRISENPAEKELLLREVTDVDQGQAQSILRFLKDAGKKRGLETLVATISCHEPFIEHLVAVGGVKQPPYAWQIRVPDYVKLFRKMKPLFEKRLSSSTYRRMTGPANFNFYSYTVQLSIKAGKIESIQRLETSEDRTIRFNPLVFVQLLLGYRSQEELQAIYPDFLVRPSHHYLIGILFPKLPSFIHTEY